MPAKNSGRMKRKNIERVVNEGKEEKSKGKRDGKLTVSKKKDERFLKSAWKRERERERERQRASAERKRER